MHTCKFTSLPTTTAYVQTYLRKPKPTLGAKSCRNAMIHVQIHVCRHEVCMHIWLSWCIVPFRIQKHKTIAKWFSHPLRSLHPGHSPRYNQAKAHESCCTFGGCRHQQSCRRSARVCCSLHDWYMYVCEWIELCERRRMHTSIKQALHRSCASWHDIKYCRGTSDGVVFRGPYLWHALSPLKIHFKHRICLHRVQKYVDGLCVECKQFH